jgi:hypothetical protein
VGDLFETKQKCYSLGFSHHMGVWAAFV